MKKRISMAARLALIGFMVAALSTIHVAAQDSSKAATTSNSTETATASQTAPVQLTPGVPDVLKLARASIADDTIMAFINNSGTTYSLGASEIVYLREQGVSDRLITAMLNQRSKTPVATESAAPAQSSTAYVAPATAYVQPSTVYVAPPAPAYTYYYSDSYYPYYYPYYGYYFPPVSLSFGFGFGGFHGGGFHGGGFHGGGFHGGHH